MRKIWYVLFVEHGTDWHKLTPRGKQTFFFSCAQTKTNWFIAIEEIKPIPHSMDTISYDPTTFPNVREGYSLVLKNISSRGSSKEWMESCYSGGSAGRNNPLRCTESPVGSPTVKPIFIIPFMAPSQSPNGRTLRFSLKYTAMREVYINTFSAKIKKASAVSALLKRSFHDSNKEQEDDEATISEGGSSSESSIEFNGLLAALTIVTAIFLCLVLLMAFCWKLKVAGYGAVSKKEPE